MHITFNQKMSSKQLLYKIRSIFPILKSVGTKGQNGRVGVIGGSYQFTGAPYYSAISSLKVGADLAHIFCSKSSSSSIKAYSPELIVHPVFVSVQQEQYKQQQMEEIYKQWLQKIKKWQKAIYSWVIGPGMGRDKYMHNFFPILIRSLPEKSIVILDADAIYYLCQHPELFQELKRFRTIITPNWRQFAMIQKVLKIQIGQILKKYENCTDQVVEIQNISGLQNFSIIIKGQRDIILGKRSFIVNTQGGLKRCGGIGDILAGAISTCAHWNMDYGIALASIITRRATRKGFQKQGRGLTAPNIIKQIVEVVKELQIKHPQSLL